MIDVAHLAALCREMVTRKHMPVSLAGGVLVPAIYTQSRDDFFKNFFLQNQFIGTCSWAPVSFCACYIANNS